MTSKLLTFYDDQRMGWTRSVTLHKENEAGFYVGQDGDEDGTVGPMGGFKFTLKDFSDVYGTVWGGRSRPFSRPVCVQASLFDDGLEAFQHLLTLAKRRGVDLMADIDATDWLDGQRQFTARLEACGLRDTSKEQFPEEVAA